MKTGLMILTESINLWSMSTQLNSVDGIIRKVIVCVVGVLMQNFDFAETSFTGQTDLTVGQYSPRPVIYQAMNDLISEVMQSWSTANETAHAMSLLWLPLNAQKWVLLELQASMQPCVKRFQVT